MPTTVPIEIFCIGKTEVDRGEVCRWLDFMGVEGFTLPDEESVTNPALLVALASKRCYRSFTVDAKQNPNLTKVRTDWTEYLDNILASKHGAVLEHSVYNFALENISRVMTSELNRHRAGWAISEGSLRFIRFSENLPYWEPDSIKGPDSLSAADAGLLAGIAQLDTGEVMPLLTDTDDKKHATRILFRQAFGHQQHVYRLLERVWADELAPDSKFKQKKEITSLMRRIVGLGVATGGVWSGNIRALRHVITLRCEPAAEEEILHVFSRIAKMMKEREPMMFGDFAQDEHGYWRPRFNKV